MRRLLTAFAAIALLVFPARATVNTSANKTIALGTGVATSFTFSFIGVSCAYISVTYTDASGNQTVLTQGTGTTQYQCALNAPLQGAIWGIGGTITYNPSSVPIASGTTLTVLRTLPYTQAITLQNLGSIASLGKGSETGLDTGVMQGQQINEAIGRALQMNIANAVAPLPLPPAAQIANLGLCADSTGNNIVGCAIPSSGVISSAMQPVVNAASLAAGRLAFSLGSMAQENINGGTCGGATIQDDASAGGANGVGYARVVFATVADATNQSVICSFHGTQRIATGPITYTLPRANTLFNGYGFVVTVVSSAVTFAPNASDGFLTVASGASVTVSAGSVCALTTNAASSGTWYLNCNNSPPTLSASVGLSALTLTLSGGLINFRDPTLANGDPFWAIPTGSLSITIPSNASLGTSSSNVPFKVYIFLAYNSATPVLGVATCSTTTTIYPCAAWETLRKSGTAITSGATNAGTLYTASTVTNDAVRLIGYAEYASGLATAGTWASTPTTLQLCLPPFVCKRPGDVIQTVWASSSTATTTSGSAATVTVPSVSITPTSSANLIALTSSGMAGGQAGDSVFVQITRAAGASPSCTTVVSQSSQGGISTLGAAAMMTLEGLDAPGVSTQVTYVVCVGANGGSPSYCAVFVTQTPKCTIKAQEIVGALEPDNDNKIRALRLAA